MGVYGSVRKSTEAYIRHWHMRHYLDLMTIIARYEAIIAWYKIIIAWYAMIITLYAILKRYHAKIITRNAMIIFNAWHQHEIKVAFHDNTYKFPEIFSWNFSRDNAICKTTRVIYHVILAFISRDIWPGMYIRGFSFIFELSKYYPREFNIPNVYLPGELRVAQIVQVSYNSYWIIITGPRTIRNSCTE